MRLFVALELDEPGRQAVAAAQERLRPICDGRGRSSLKWVKPEQVHLTLAFLGEVSEDRARAVIEVMGQSIDHGPFVVGFGGVGMFPSDGAPRVLWLGVTRGAHDVTDVRGKVLERLASAGVIVADRFHAHLTLARWRTLQRGNRRLIVNLREGRELFEESVTGVTLIDSRLSSSGPTYRVVSRVRLEVDPHPPLQSS